MKYNYILICLLLSFFSCSEKRAEIIESSPESNVQVLIKGVKPNLIDPFHVEITIQGYGSSETISTDIHSKDLNASNVVFNWLSENECFFTFHQQDNTIRRMHLMIDERQVLLQEDGSNSVSN
ncbi:MAG: hypothetical protein ACK4ND_16875 [Cytophagaceae bacterium]